jgi:transposase
VALVRAGRGAEELAKEFEPFAATIHSWVKQSQRDAGRRADILSSAEPEELRRLRRDNRQLRQERDIPAKGEPLAAIGPSDNGDAWFAQSDARRRRGLRGHGREPGGVPDRDDGEDDGHLAQRRLLVAKQASIGPCAC